ASNKQSSDSKLIAELRSLRAANDRLKALLAQNGIAWQEDAPDTKGIGWLAQAWLCQRSFFYAMG
ncbi:MAG: hypothetical protein KKD63_15915, partial [Proteobacteria bacterium]|nr:hypothetical protein [Pseudomonadota bacterium]